MCRGNRTCCRDLTLKPAVGSHVAEGKMGSPDIALEGFTLTRYPLAHRPLLIPLPRWARPAHPRSALWCLEWRLVLHPTSPF